MIALLPIIISRYGDFGPCLSVEYETKTGKSVLYEILFLIRSFSGLDAFGNQSEQIASTLDERVIERLLTFFRSFLR